MASQAVIKSGTKVTNGDVTCIESSVAFDLRRGKNRREAKGKRGRGKRREKKYKRNEATTVTVASASASACIVP